MGEKPSPASPLPPPAATADSADSGPGAAHADHARLVRRIDGRLVPMLSALYLVCFLCRQNIGNAKTFGLAADLALTPRNYQIGLTLFFISYSLLDIPANGLLRQLRPNVWLPFITLLSGVVTVAMGLSRSTAGLYVTRLALGATECGLFPGVAYVITLWYRRREAQFRQALFFCAASMAGAFSGALAVGLARMDGLGGLAGWRWILIVEGLLAVAVATLGFRLVLDVPARTTFLTDDERKLLLHRLAADELGEAEDGDDGDDGLLTAEERERLRSAAAAPLAAALRQVFSDPHMVLQVLVFWGVTCPLYSISLCLPTIVVEMGYTTTTANFLTVPIYLAACVLSLLVAFCSDRAGVRAPFLAGSFATMAIGFLIAALAPPRAAYAGMFIAACGVYPAFPGMVAWFANNLASARKRASAMALVIGTGSLGGAMGVNFYRHQDAPRYLLGHLLNLAVVSVGAVAGLILYVRYARANAKRAGERRAVQLTLAADIAAARQQAAAAAAATAVHGQDGAADDAEKLVRHRHLVAKEEDLAREGDHSLWFQYML